MDHTKHRNYNDANRAIRKGKQITNFEKPFKTNQTIKGAELKNTAKTRTHTD